MGFYGSTLVSIFGKLEIRVRIGFQKVVNIEIKISLFLFGAFPSNLLLPKRVGLHWVCDLAIWLAELVKHKNKL